MVAIIGCNQREAYFIDLGEELSQQKLSRLQSIVWGRFLEFIANSRVKGHFQRDLSRMEMTLRSTVFPLLNPLLSAPRQRRAGHSG